MPFVKLEVHDLDMMVDGDMPGLWNSDSRTEERRIFSGISQQNVSDGPLCLRNEGAEWSSAHISKIAENQMQLWASSVFAETLGKIQQKRSEQNDYGRRRGWFFCFSESLAFEPRMTGKHIRACNLYTETGWHP